MTPAVWRGDAAAEERWLSSSDGQVLLQDVADRYRLRYLSSSGALIERRLRLWACACCRHIWDRILARPARRFVEAAEKYADGVLKLRELNAARTRWQRANRQCYDPTDFVVQKCGESAYHITQQPYLSREVPPAVQADLLRCLFGNIYRPLRRERRFPVCPNCGCRTLYGAVAVDEAQHFYCKDCYHQTPWLQTWSGVIEPAWITSTARVVAQALSNERNFNELGVLSDALEEAGCSEEGLLEHLRSPGPHARGCWAVDFVLGRE